jgi:L-idonate 5-dehydrogenase
VRAIVINGKLDLAIQEVPTVEPGPGDVRLRMTYAGICGSDLHYYHEGANGAFALREPLVPGHELAGLVDLDPSGELAPGTPVTVHPATFGTPETDLELRPHLWQGGRYLGSAASWPHTQGGMSEYLTVTRGMVRELPAQLPLSRAALAEPLAVALHAINVADGVAGKRVLVSGAGPIGLLAAGACLALGAAEVVAVDVIEEPLRRARELGVHDVLRLGVDPLPDAEFDVVLECSGVPAAVTTSVSLARAAGIVVLVGMPPDEPRAVNLAPVVTREIQVRGAFRFHDEIDLAVELLVEHPDLERVVTHVLPADRAEEAFALAKDSSASGKVLVSLWPDDDVVVTSVSAAGER